MIRDALKQAASEESHSALYKVQVTQDLPSSLAKKSLRRIKQLKFGKEGIFLLFFLQQ